MIEWHMPVCEKHYIYEMICFVMFFNARCTYGRMIGGGRAVTVAMKNALKDMLASYLMLFSIVSVRQIKKGSWARKQIDTDNDAKRQKNIYQSGDGNLKYIYIYIYFEQFKILKLWK